MHSFNLGAMHVPTDKVVVARPYMSGSGLLTSSGEKSCTTLVVPSGWLNQLVQVTRSITNLKAICPLSRFLLHCRRPPSPSEFSSSCVVAAPKFPWTRSSADPILLTALPVSVATPSAGSTTTLLGGRRHNSLARGAPAMTMLLDPVAHGTASKPHHLLAQAGSGQATNRWCWTAGSWTPRLTTLGIRPDSTIGNQFSTILYLAKKTSASARHREVEISGGKERRHACENEEGNRWRSIFF